MEGNTSNEKEIKALVSDVKVKVSVNEEDEDIKTVKSSKNTLKRCPHLSVASIATRMAP